MIELTFDSAKSNDNFCVEVKSIEVKARVVTVTGPKGTVVKNFKHMSCEIKIMNMTIKKVSGKYVRVRMWNSGYRQAC